VFNATARSCTQRHAAAAPGSAGHHQRTTAAESAAASAVAVSRRAGGGGEMNTVGRRQGPEPAQLARSVGLSAQMPL